MFICEFNCLCSSFISNTDDLSVLFGSIDNNLIPVCISLIFPGTRYGPFLNFSIRLVFKLDSSESFISLSQVYFIQPLQTYHNCFVYGSIRSGDD